MGTEVYANGDSVSAKAGDGKVIAAMPDVCLSPPPTPAGPVPAPYPDSSKSGDMQEGTKTVQLAGDEAMMKDSSFFKTSPLGDEAATNGLGAGVMTACITGQTHFTSWSMDVQLEGANADRHTDMTTSNHASDQPANGQPPMMEAEKPAPPPKTPPEDECPCCHQKPRHANQKDPDTGAPYESVSEADWYNQGVAEYQAKVDSIPAYLASNPGFESSPAGQSKINATKQQLEDAKKANQTLGEARAKSPPCENLHDPPDKGCGTYMKKTNKEPKTGDKKVRNQLGFTDGVRKESIRRYQAMGRPVSNNSGVAHKTPLAAGGCPSSQDNLIPNEALSAECQGVDAAQTTLQTKAAEGFAK
jgi:hypothetical protein